jgi:LemA protein
MSVKDMANAEKQMQDAVSQINLVAEQYPDLKASQNFLMLQNSIAESEKNLAVARRVYNASVTILNKKVVNFPSSLIAPLAKATKADLFEVSEGKSKDVDMTF